MALIGATFIVVGMIVCSTANTMNIFIGKFYALALASVANHHHRWNGYCRRWSRHKRANCLGRYLGTRAYPETWQVYRSTDLYDCSVLPRCALGATHRLPCWLEVLRPLVWCLVDHRTCHDSDILPSSASRELAGLINQRHPRSDRLCWRFLQHCWYALVHLRHAMGRLSGMHLDRHERAMI